MNIRIRRRERIRRRLRQQNRISLHLPERTASKSEEDHVDLANGPFSHHKSTHIYTKHTTLTSVAICVIVNHQEPKFLVNIADKTATYVRGTHRPAAVRCCALIGQSHKYGWLKKRRRRIIGVSLEVLHSGASGLWTFLTSTCVCVDTFLLTRVTLASREARTLPGHTLTHTPSGLIGRANVCLWTVGG